MSEPEAGAAGVLTLPPLAPGADAAPAARTGAVPTATTAGAAAPDERWARVFGATEVGSSPRAVAVSGTTVYVGGGFTGVMAGMPEGPTTGSRAGTAKRGTGWGKASTAPSLP